MTIVAANWVGENTTTIGTGPLALSGAISTFCPFSVLPDGSEVYYTLQEGFNRETGIGVVSNGTLTRKVQATLVAGVYTETDIPISLSGNGQVFAVINADFMTRIYNFSLDVADSVSAAAASAKSSSDSAYLANDYKTQSAQSAENAAASAQSASDSKSDAVASQADAANSKTASYASAQSAADSATAAATSATASANSATTAATSAANAAAAIVSTVKSIITFTTGGTLNSNLDRISDGVYLYYWTGSYPVSVHANSTVDGTGGINIGAWACDTDLPLRKNLVSSDGEKLIGKCAHVSALRSIEPSHSDQTITLLRVVPGGPVVNLQLTYDADDTTSADDGYSVFVTAGGARWKADTSEGIDVRWAGLNLAGTNLGSCLNKIIQGELAKIIAADDYMAGVTNIKIKAKNHPKHNKKFVLDETVSLPSFFNIQAMDFMTAVVTSDIDGWVITNNVTGLPPSVTDFVNHQGTSVIDSLSGRIETLGPGVSASTCAGVKFGNTSGGSTVLDLRDAVIKNINVRGFDKGLQLFGWDTYINTFESCNIAGNNYNIYANGDKSNGGEKILFRSCVLGNASKSNVYWNTPLTDVTFDNTSIDYAKQHAFHFGPLGRGNQFRLTNGSHVEGFGGMLIYSELSTITSVSQGYFLVDASCRIDAAGVVQSAWAPRRQIIYDPNNNIKPDIACPIVFHGLSEPHVSLTGYLDDTARYSRLTYECPGSPYEDCLSSYAHTLNSGLYKFSGTAGAAISSTDTDSGTGYKFTKSDPAVVIAYGEVGADGLQSIAITTTSTSQTVEIFNPNLFSAIPFRARLYSAISVNIAGLTSGDVLINTRIASYLSDKTTGLLTSGGTKIGIVGQWSVSGTPLTISDFLGIQTFIENSYQSQLSHLSRPAILLTGWVGTIKIKLPAFWVQRGFGLGTPA